MQNTTTEFIDEAYVYQIIDKLEELVILNDENAPREIAKLTETLNAGEQEMLIERWARRFYYDVDPKELTDDKLIQAFFLYKIKGD